MEWSNELILEFLKIYEGEPAIWNPNHPDHKNRYLVHNSWKRIEDNLSVECTVAELKKKKDALMATFRKLSQKVKASTVTGTGTDDVFKPDWFAYEYMHRFLHGIYKPNEIRNSEMFQDEGLTEDSENVDEKYEEVTIYESQLEPPKAKSARRNIHLSPDIDQKMDKVFKNVTDTQMYTPDECSLYGELLATKLRALDADTRETAMIEIDLLVYRLKHRHAFISSFN